MSYIKDLKEANVAYLGGVRISAKIDKSYNNGVCTYCVYLAPYNMAGATKNGTPINVCPNAEHCHDLCLQGSGRNRMDNIVNGYEGSTINLARIRKTRLFYNNRPLYMRLLIHEIARYKAFAEKNGMKFAVRLNGTSDLSPLIMKWEGKNILELFPDVQFYDYTKVVNRLALHFAYPNYDLTFSFDGHNWDDAEAYLQLGGKVAVVFDTHTMPLFYKGYKVVDANTSDARFLDPKGTIMGLAYHAVVTKDGKYVPSRLLDKYKDEIDTTFVIRTEDNPEVIM